MVRAHQEQSQRLREPAWQAGRDYAPPSVDSFRVDRERADEARVLEVQRSLTQPEDIGAGAGPDHNSNEENCSCNTAISARPD
ncbi:MAG TPA: hypothetical protein VKV73_15405 [Chloroflexota bacterium]|nr:hypothetical protein [Chloroflexota bacterium]